MPDADDHHALLEQLLAERVGLDDPTTAGLVLRAMRFGRLVERQVQAVVRPAGLERSDLSVLSSLLLTPPGRGQTPTELARTVVQTTSGMTKTVNRLVARGLVRRDDDRPDGRHVLVLLTDEGRRTAEALLHELVEGVDRALDGLDPPDRAALGAALEAALPSLERAAGVSRI